MLQLLAFLLLVDVGSADLYLHNPRGSNNRLNEKSANRQNANRLFDSQNNNRGGYNVGDRLATPAGGNKSNQYEMQYFQSAGEKAPSFLNLEWTNQHGCGGHETKDPHKVRCNLVLQYMCTSADVTSQDKRDLLRNGVTTQTQSYKKPKKSETTRRTARRYRTNQARGLHEPWWYYDACYVRERNKGLFVADQQLQENNLDYSSAIYTRQNAGGARRAFECPEERDYYPYWHPSPWRDIAILTDQTEKCDWYREQSFNLRPRHECWPNSGKRSLSLRWNNEQDCTGNGNRWVELHSYLDQTDDNEETCVSRGFIYGLGHDAQDVDDLRCLVPLPEPECKQAPWSRVNHHGNGREAVQANYTWTLPSFPSGEDKRCVLRMRYNISTDDYDPSKADASLNGEASPVRTNPEVDVGASSPLQLAINTAQTGRTFQDRSHTFLLRPRPQGLEDKTIHNLNVRGKRGNIVQTYPATEYDFVPHNLQLDEGHVVHIQWTGSNTHNNGNPAGDGQAGDAGNGKTGTDRHNMMELSKAGENLPLPEERMQLVRGALVYWSALSDVERSWKDVALELATAGYYLCARKEDCPQHEGETVDTKPQLNKELDNAPASYPGLVLGFNKGNYFYTSSRNNDFSNRSQKAKITVG